MAGSAGTLNVTISAQTGPLAQGMKEGEEVIKRFSANSSMRFTQFQAAGEQTAMSLKHAFGSVAIGISSAAAAAQGAERNVVLLGANMAAAFATGGPLGLGIAAASAGIGSIAGKAAEAARSVANLKSHLSRLSEVRMGEAATMFGSLDALRGQISDVRLGDAAGTAGAALDRKRRAADLVRQRGQAENDVLTFEDQLKLIKPRSTVDRAVGMLSGVPWDADPKRQALEANLADAKERRAAAIAELEAENERTSLEKQLDDAKTITEAKKYGIDLVARLQAKQDAAAKAAGDELGAASVEGARRAQDLVARLADTYNQKLQERNRLLEEAARAAERGRQADQDQVEAMTNLLQLERDRIDAKNAAAEADRQAAQDRLNASRREANDAQKSRRSMLDAQYAGGYGPLQQRRDESRAQRRISHFRNHEDNLAAEARDAASWYAGSNIRKDGTGWGPGAKGGTNDFWAPDLGSYFDRLNSKPALPDDLAKPPGLLNPGVGPNGEVPGGGLGDAAAKVGGAGDAAQGAGGKLSESANLLGMSADKLQGGASALDGAAAGLNGAATKLSGSLAGLVATVQSIQDTVDNLVSQFENAAFIGS